MNHTQLIKTLPNHFKSLYTSMQIAAFTGILALAGGIILSMPVYAAGTQLSLSKTQFDVGAEPAWVNVNQTIPVPSTQKETLPFRMVLNEKQINLTTGRSRYTHQVQQVLSSLGVSKLADIELTLQPSYQTLLLHHIWIVRDGQKIDVTSKYKPRFIQREKDLENGMLDGEISIIITLQELKVGDLLDVSYTYNGENPVFDGTRSGYITINDDQPIDELKARIITPKDNPLQLQPFGTGDLPIKTTMVGNNIEYTLEIKSIPRLSVEGGVTAADSGYQWLNYSSFKNWHDVAMWGVKLNNEVLNANQPATEKLYQQLASKSKDDQTFIRNALHYVQHDIRYLGLEFDVNSHKPHHPDEVISLQYGDCKDKALLLTTLLKKRGLNASPALVATNLKYGIEDELPSPKSFNHVITMLDFSGKIYWLDGTRSYQEGTLDNLSLYDYGYALPLTEKTIGLKRMYPNWAMKKRSQTDEHYTITDYNSPVRLEVKSILFADYADWYRSKMNNLPIEERNKETLSFYKQYFDDIKRTQDIQVSDDKDANMITINEYYSIDSFFEKVKEKNNKAEKNDENHKQPNQLKHQTPMTAFVDELDHVTYDGERKHNLTLGQPRYMTANLYFHYPTNMIFTIDETPTIIETEGIRYVTQDRYANKTLKQTAELTIDKPWLRPAEVAAFIKKSKEIREQWNMSISLSTESPISLDAIKRLKQAYKGE